MAGPALADLEDAVHLDTLQDIGATTDPADLDAVDSRAVAQAEMWIQPVMALVPAAAVDLIDLGQVTGDHLDPCADAVPVAPSAITMPMGRTDQVVTQNPSTVPAPRW